MKLSKMGFRDFSINQKLISVVGAVSAISAFVIGGALFSFQMFSLRSQFSDNVVSVAEVVANYAAAPVAFGDRIGGEEVLSVVKSNIDISSAEIRFQTGEVFAKFGDEAVITREFPDNEIVEFDGWTLYVTRGVIVPNQSYAWLVIAADFKRLFFSSIKSMGLALIGVLIVGVLVAVISTAAFRNVIVGPIVRLADVARQIASVRDYTLRAEVEGQDEVGFMTSTFNEMLSRIEDGDRELRDAYAQLERESSERERLQNDLVTTSRMAGMAEVATGVLHNVGNVLNTVNLSVQQMRERLETSRLSHLRRAVDLINSQNGNLGEYLTSDSKGKEIPGFISKITDHLTNENIEINEEMRALTGHVDHIKEIVATQQSFARVLGVTENLPVKDLVEDALRLNGDSLARHSISVVREFNEVPNVMADRHKVVQILVNLLTNAKDAIEKNSSEDRTITIRTTNNDEQWVEIEVIDKGSGIKPETVASIFNHGFTTKSHGHGFGLHLSALSAQEMGGFLQVHSDGEGHGAVFTLIIPVALELAEK
jgi:two-component system NtrC family sensor kinase